MTDIHNRLEKQASNPLNENPLIYVNIELFRTMKCSQLQKNTKNNIIY